MLVAYGPDHHPAIAEETPLEQLQHWSREHMLYCPNCRGNVHVRGGPEKRTQLHFAHQRGECAWSTETESLRHARGKLVIAQWLRGQFSQAVVTLEERLPEPNRIADVFVTHTNGQRWAIEFQCAPLAIEEWQHRHQAYARSGISDIWIIGTNRREKQEAFIEAILATSHEILFLDPQVTPPRIWLRWPITRQIAQEWQASGKAHNPYMLSLDGWVGRTGYGVTLIGALHDLRINEHMRLLHPGRTAIETRDRLYHVMSNASGIDERMLLTYLRQRIDEEAVHILFIPLLRAYLRDPDLLRRYNYGRGLPGIPISEEDRRRIHNAHTWLARQSQRGYSIERIQELARELPFTGPYAALAGYVEALLTLRPSEMATTQVPQAHNDNE
jgi:hypothetical protein